MLAQFDYGTKHVTHDEEEKYLPELQISWLNAAPPIGVNGNVKVVLDSYMKPLTQASATITITTVAFSAMYFQHDSCNSFPPYNAHNINIKMLSQVSKILLTTTE